MWLTPLFYRTRHYERSAMRASMKSTRSAPSRPAGRPPAAAGGLVRSPWRDPPPKAHGGSGSSAIHGKVGELLRGHGSIRHRRRERCAPALGLSVSFGQERFNAFRVAGPSVLTSASSRAGSAVNWSNGIDLVRIAAGLPIPGVAEQPDRSQLAVHLDLIIGVRNDEGLHRTEVSPTAGGTGPPANLRRITHPRRTMAA